jgi:hypothetical protein
MVFTAFRLLPPEHRTRKCRAPAAAAQYARRASTAQTRVTWRRSTQKNESTTRYLHAILQRRLHRHPRHSAELKDLGINWFRVVGGSRFGLQGGNSILHLRKIA